MKENFNYEQTKIKVLDFTLSIERLENSIEILNTFYDLCFEDYEDFWRINGIIQALMFEYETVKQERKEVRALFLD